MSGLFSGQEVVRICITTKQYKATSAFLLFLIVFSPGILLAQNPSVAGGDIIVNINPSTNMGTKTIFLRNDANEPNDPNMLDVFLHVDDFILQTTKKSVPARVTFKYIDSKQKQLERAFVQAEIPKGEVLVVTLEVSEFSEAGEAHANLLNNNDLLASIKVIKFNPPFNVSLSSVGADKHELIFQRGKPSRLILKNEDSMTYPVKWSLLLSNVSTVIGPFSVVLPGESTIPVNFDLPDEIFKSWFTGLIRDYEQEGDLVLQFDPQGDVAYPAPPTKDISVKVKMQHESKFWRSAVSNLVVLAFLFLGAASSLFLSLYIPNKLQSIELLGCLEKLWRKTKKISSKIDSSLRVEARVERLRLAQLIESVWLIKAEALTILNGYRGEIELLDRRVGLIQELDQVVKLLEFLQAKTTNAPAKVLDDMGNKIQQATERLKLSTPKEADFQMVHETIQQTRDRLEKIGCEDPELAEQLAESVRKLKDVYDGEIGKSPKCDELRLRIKTLFDVFKNPAFQNKSKIDPVHYHWLSNSVEGLFVLRHYIREWENAIPANKKRIEDQEDELLKCLRISNWQALHRARQLRQQIQENLFANDVREALANKTFSISVIPTLPLPNQKVQLEINFDKKELNTCTARQDFSCEWDFGSIGKEVGWNIWHYFRNQDESQFTVRFRDLEGKLVEEDGGSNPVELSHSIQLQRERKTKKLGGKERLELTRLAVVLGIAVLGLMAGAMEQLMKLDIIPAIVAIFLIGFGADTVKNIVTGKPQGTT